MSWPALIAAQGCSSVVAARLTVAKCQMRKASEVQSMLIASSTPGCGICACPAAEATHGIPFVACQHMCSDTVTDSVDEGHSDADGLKGVPS